MAAEIEVEKPKGRVFDLGVIDLDIQTTIHNSFDMPFDGYIVRVDASWPAGALNAIGFNLRAGPSILIPTNPEVQYVADDDVNIPFCPVVEKLKKGSTVTAEIRNESTTSKLDLQVRVTITNFDPRKLGSI